MIRSWEEEHFKKKITSLTKYKNNQLRVGFKFNLIMMKDKIINTKKVIFNLHCMLSMNRELALGLLNREERK